GSIFLPMTPPLALISSNAIMHTSRRDTSLMAMVPESEWSTPTFTVPPCARRTAGNPMSAAAPAPTTAAVLRKLLLVMPCMPDSFHGKEVEVASGGGAVPRATAVSRRAARTESKRCAAALGECFQAIAAAPLHGWLPVKEAGGACLARM